MRDVLYVVIMMFAFVVIAVFSYILLVNFNNSPIIAGNALSTATMTKAEVAFTSYYDVGFLIIFAVSIVAILITGHLLPTKPIFFVPFVLSLLILVVITAMVANWYYDMATNEVVSVYIASFTYIPFVMTNLPILVFFLALFTGIVIYTGIPSKS